MMISFWQKLSWPMLLEGKSEKRKVRWFDLSWNMEVCQKFENAVVKESGQGNRNSR